MSVFDYTSLLDEREQQQQQKHVCFALEISSGFIFFFDVYHQQFTHSQVERQYQQQQQQHTQSKSLGNCLQIDILLKKSTKLYGIFRNPFKTNNNYTQM